MKQDWKPGTMIYPLPAVLVSCGKEESEYNIITVAWTGTICTNPPMCYISVRPERHSYDIIKKNMEFVINLTTKDMAFPTDVVNVRADDRNLNPETGKFELAEANPLVYVHGGYYDLGEKIGKFGWSVEKKNK